MIRVFFDNIEKTLSAHITKAENRIYVAVAWFTNEAIFGCLLNAMQKNVEIKVLILDDILNRNEFGLDFGVLVNSSADVRFAVSNRGCMHNKFCVIDNVVITGSYNWTYHANNNDENIVIIDEPNIVNGYCEQFGALFNNCAPIKLPYEHLKWTEVKEGDFSELGRNIYREVNAKNDVNRILRQNKLIRLNNAYKSGSIEELKTVSLLPITEHFMTITDVFSRKSQEFELELWEENNVGKARDNIDGHIRLGKWYYIPNEIKEDKDHHEYIEGIIKTNASRNVSLSLGMTLKIYDKEFIATIKKIMCNKTMSVENRTHILDNVLCINSAKMFYYQFPSPMFNKSQSRTWPNSTPRIIHGIDLLGVAKEVDGDIIVFYEGWDPQKKGEKIMKEFFVKA